MNWFVESATLLVALHSEVVMRGSDSHLVRKSDRITGQRKQSSFRLSRFLETSNAL